MYMIKCQCDTVIVKEPEYTYSSPNIRWINVVHKYNRGAVMTIKLRNTIEDTRQAAYFIMRASAIIGKLLHNIQTITDKKKIP